MSVQQLIFYVVMFLILQDIANFLTIGLKCTIINLLYLYHIVCSLYQNFTSLQEIFYQTERSTLLHCTYIHTYNNDVQGSRKMDFIWGAQLDFLVQN